MKTPNIVTFLWEMSYQAGTICLQRKSTRPLCKLSPKGSVVDIRRAWRNGPVAVCNGGPYWIWTSDQAIMSRSYHWAKGLENAISPVLYDYTLNFPDCLIKTFSLQFPPIARRSLWQHLRNELRARGFTEVAFPTKFLKRRRDNIQT